MLIFSFIENYMPVVGWPLEHPILNANPSSTFLQLCICVPWIHIRGVHFLQRQSYLCKSGTITKVPSGISEDSRASVIAERLGKIQPCRSLTVSLGLILDTNTARYLHLKNSALTRQLAEDPAQGSQMNARKREAEGLCLIFQHQKGKE